MKLNSSAKYGLTQGGSNDDKIVLTPQGGSLVAPQRSGERRQALQARRDRLFKDLVRIELQHRSQKIGATRYTNRRQELVTLLELVYGKLEQEELVPGVDSAQGPVLSASPVGGRARTAG